MPIFVFQQGSVPSNKVKRAHKGLENNLLELIYLFCLRIYFEQTRLHKTHDFGQIQNPID
jgi:hypothetical protein